MNIAMQTVGSSTHPMAEKGGCYIYCVADGGEGLSLGNIGLEGSEVYTIPYRDMVAVAHSCVPQPYQSSNAETVKAWVMAHHQVVKVAWERWGTVLPSSFNTIIQGEEMRDAGQNIVLWLEASYESLKQKIDRLRGKAEYGIQIFWYPRTIAENLAQSHPEIQRLNQEILSKSQGLAYMYKQKLESGLLRQELEVKADQCLHEFYGRIRRHVADLWIEKTKKADEATQMLLNLSCLVSPENYPGLDEELGKINDLEGFSVRFTGPWPPYCFVNGL